jgi:subtilisin-like proprotein convertase family protein
MRHDESTNARRASLYTLIAPSAAGVALSMLGAVLPALASAQVWPGVPTTRTRNFNNLSGIAIQDLCADPANPECEPLIDIYTAPGAPLPPVVAGGPYPSTIEVPAAAFVAGSKITDVNVTIRNLSHQFLDDVDILLVGPQGQYVMLASNVSAAGGGDNPNGIEAVDLNWKFDDSARLPLPNSIDNSGRASTRATTRVNGVDVPNPLYNLIYPEWTGVWTDTSLRTFKPSDYDNGGDNDIFPAPAPQVLSTPTSVVTHNATTGVPVVSGGTPLSTFNGTSPVGTWKLYVADDFYWFDGGIEGWELEITAKQP